MARPKALIKEEVPENVIGEVALYLSKHCGVPGCAAVFHLDNAKDIITIIINFNKKKQEKIEN